MANDTKLVKVEGKLVRVPSDASPDEIDQIAGGPAKTSAMAPGSFQMHKGGPVISPADITAMAKSRTAIGSMPPLGTTPIEGMMLGAEAGKQVTPEDISREQGYDALLSPLALLSGYGTGNPVATAKGLGGSVIGSGVGAALGRYVGGPKYGDVGAGLGGLAGGVYGGYRALSGRPAVPQGVSKVPGIVGRMGRAMEAFSEEPKTVPGAAREMAGGTAAEAGAGVSGGQAGPSQGPKNASELSSTVQRVRSGVAPGTAASPLSLEAAASQTGMASAAGGAPAAQAQMINPAQLDILRKLKAKGLPVQIPGEP